MDPSTSLRAGTAAARLLEKLGPHLNPPEDRTYDRIVLSSNNRFLEEGFAKITVGELCHDLRVSKKTFYKSFRDKEDLVLAVVAHKFKAWHPKILAIIGEDAPPDIRLDRMMDFIINTVMKNITVVFLRDMQTLMPDLWEALNAFRLSQASNVMSIIEEGQKIGLYRADIDADKLSRILLLFINRVVDPKILYEHGLELREMVEIFFTVLRYGIYERPKRKRGAK